MNQPFTSHALDKYTDRSSTSVPIRFGQNNLLVNQDQHVNLIEEKKTYITPNMYQMNPMNNYYEQPQHNAQITRIPEGAVYTFQPPQYFPPQQEFVQQQQRYFTFADIQYQIALKELEKHCLESMLLQEQLKKNPYILQFTQNAQTCTEFEAPSQGLPDFSSAMQRELPNHPDYGTRGILKKTLNIPRHTEPPPDVDCSVQKINKGILKVKDEDMQTEEKACGTDAEEMRRDSSEDDEEESALSQKEKNALKKVVTFMDEMPECCAIIKKTIETNSDTEDTTGTESDTDKDDDNEPRTSGEGSEEECLSDQEVEREKTDQSQQTTPTTPPAETEVNSLLDLQENMSSLGEKRMKEIEEVRKESVESPTPSIPPGGSPISGILKGGRLWKQQSIDIVPVKAVEIPQVVEQNITSDDEGGSKRSVRFTESNEGTRDSCDGAAEKPPTEAVPEEREMLNDASPEPTEMMLTFKLGNHVLISNNSLKPNSAVRQLFPCTKPMAQAKPGDDASHQQYLVTAESLRAFEEAKRSKLPQILQSGEADESIKRAIERNTLRRSLIRYEPRSKKSTQKTDNSLVERIKQLTCDVDEPPVEEQSRASPPGEEARNSPEISAKNAADKSFSPSSTSSSNSSVSSTYKKITDLFAKKEKPDIQVVEPLKHQAPDIGGPQDVVDGNGGKIQNMEHRKQFLSTLAPLTACVSGTMNPDDYYYHANTQGERMSMASSIGTEYSLEDIEEGLRKDEEDNKRIAPDVLAGTPSASESADELAMFVQQDASRIERIKKKYQQDDEDDEHDDYGFNRRPSVRGIKPRFGSTNEILQQIQNQIQPPNNTPPRNAPVAWPYYSETNLSGVDNKRQQSNINQPPNYQYAQQYRPTTLIDENAYQNCANQRCTQVTYRPNVNLYSSPIMRVGGGCNEYYQSLPRARSGRPQSPPPQEVSKGFHQTMMYIPYNHIEGYQPPNQYYEATYSRVSNQNQINKRYIDHYASKSVRPVYNQGSRSESPLPSHYSTARATQTPAAAIPAGTYYPRYRQPVPNGVVWGEGSYAAKVNRHSFPASAARYPNADNISLTDSDSHSSGQLHNGFKDSIPNSPTKTRFIERGVPEGAASVSPQDCNTVQSASTMTSPTSPQNPQASTKPLFYAMNV